MIGSTISHYRIEEELGRGGMGVVYRAVDERLGRPVALKFLPVERTGDPDGRRRFREEARAASALNHPNILTIHDFGETSGRTYIVMEYLDGETLEKRLEAGPLEMDDIFGIIRPVADALAAAHDHGIIHRDVKPGNIMLMASGRVKLMDFGVAKLAGREALTGEGQMLGTSSWMSPEQIRGEHVDKRADLWSLGVVLYQMCTNEHPFRASRVEAVVYKVLNERPESVCTANPEIPERLDGIVSKSLEKDRKNRYADAHELLADLDDAAVQAGVESGAGATASDASSSRPTLITAIGLGLILLAAALFIIPGLRSAVVPVPSTSIAVLPVTVTGSEALSTSSLDDLHREVTGMMASLAASGDGISVIPAETVLSENVSTIQGARSVLHVDRVLGVSVSGSESKLDLDLALIDTGDRDTLSRNTVRVSFPAVLSSMDQTSAAVTAMVEADSLMDRSVALDRYLDARILLDKADTAGELDRAIDAFELAVAENRRHALSHAGLGEAYWLKFKRTRDADYLGRAAEEAHIALGLDDSLARVQVTLGLTYLEQGREQEAAAAFRHALEIDDDLFDAVRGLGRVFWQQGRVEQAIAYFERLTTLRPDDPDGYTLLGRLHYNEGDIEQAADAFRRAVDVAPTNALAHSNLAVAYGVLGRKDERRRHLDKSIELNPRPMPLRNRAADYYFRGDFEQAVDDLEHALDISNQEFETWSMLANALYWTEERGQAAREAWIETARLTGEALRIDSTNLEALNYRVAALANLGRYTEATQAIERLKTDQRLRGTHYNTLAHAYERMGQRDSALVYVERAIYEGIKFKYVLESPWLENLRNDERFSDIRAEMGISRPPS